VRFTAVCRDRDGHEVVISLPLLFIADVLVDGQSALSLASLIAGAIPLFESVSPSVETGGHPLALAAGAPGRTSFEVHRIQLTAGRADPPDGRLGFHPRLRGLDLEIPALRQMLGAGGVVRAAFADAFARAPGDGFGPENPGELLLTLPNVAVDFSGKADRSGGLVKPSYMADSLSRLNGPVSSAVTGSHDPHQVFDALQAKLFGAVSLADVIGAIEPHNAPRLVTEAPQPGAMPGVVYDWQPPVVSKGIFRAENAHRAATLNVRAAAGSVDCTLQNFTLDLFSDGEAMLRLHFDELAFHAAPQGKPTVVVNLADVEFVGVLGFVEALRSLIPRGGAGGAAPVLDISAAGVRSSLSVGVPDLAFGVFALQNISVEAGFNVPFLDDPVSASFAFCTRDRPFLLAVSGFGGGGYFGVIVDADGVRHLEAAFEFGASLSMNLGVASGGVSVMGGFLFQMQNEGSASLTGYLRISGEVEVLGLVSVSIVLALSLYYDFGTGKCIGRATLVLEIEIGFFSMSVSLECERRFAGSDGDPPFAEVMGPAEGARGDFPWREYCRAFAAGEG
jgi:hypothetical protein